MKKPNMMKESYERSALVITIFAEEDVITTSNPFQDDILDLIGDNDTPIASNGDAKSYRMYQNR